MHRFVELLKRIPLLRRAARTVFRSRDRNDQIPSQRRLRDWLDHYDRSVKHKPLLLKLETTNACNARCVFCAYTDMTRPRQVMSRHMFFSAVRSYSDMGGGAVTLTPCTGEILTDPRLLERFEVLRRHPEIGDISFTTNLIAHERLSDGDWVAVLRETHYLFVSLGGLDRETYQRMYRVDKCEKVLAGVARVLSLREKAAPGLKVHLGFRTVDHDFTQRSAEYLQPFLKNGVAVSNCDRYGNWAGNLDLNRARAWALPLVTGGRRTKRGPCPVMMLACGVLSSGVVTACSCCDCNGTLFPLGSIGAAGSPTLAEFWRGARRAAMVSEHVSGKLLVCARCTMGGDLAEVPLPPAFDLNSVLGG